MSFNERDTTELAARKIPVDEAQRQIDLLRKGEVFAEVTRPCTLGDGVIALDESDRQTLAATFRAASSRMRLARFIPASGAATRMFAHLRGQGDDPLRHTFFASIRRLPFGRLLDDALQRAGKSLDECLEQGDHGALTGALLDDEYLGYENLPKGSIPFHAYPDGHHRTGFQEQLVEAAGMMLQGASMEVHFTVPESFNERSKLELIAYAAALHPDLKVSFSIQSPTTETLALDHTGEALRYPDGALVFRPGGHGALLRNLGSLDHDLVFVKNIDNIVPEPHQSYVNYNKSVLGGLLLSLLAERNALIRELNDKQSAERAVQFLQRWFFSPEWNPPATAAELSTCLNRPIRVCGMVRNTGEPGGGPFWLAGKDASPSVQILESAQIDRSNPQQESLFASSTHFNPVDMVCALNDHEGRPYDLSAFANHDRVIVTRKPYEGREIRVIELPGLWNGGMEHWLTVFVEVPADTFAPVKTVNDLLRPAHQL